MAVNKQGKWIYAGRGSKGTPAQARLVCFRKVITLAEPSESMPLRISADGRYKLYVNAALVCFGPCKGDDKRRYADRIDLLPFLRLEKRCWPRSCCV
jgi:hypothetical protein